MVISCIQGDFNDQYKNHVQIAKYLSEINGKLYFCSTSNVFDGDPTKVHYENDVCCPESDYGKFKYNCENALRKILNDNLCIIRLPAIWGKNSKRLNNLKDMLESGKDIEVYCNLFRTTNTDIMLAKQINYIVTNNLNGIFHLGSIDVINYYDFISKLIIKLGYKNKKINKIRLPEEKYFLALGSIRNELPNYLKISNSNVINYLAS
ncbi:MULTISPECIES: sugar nucleotide-binding protein [Clostridium]|uniref:sugar nucleotide-binding protein n=1 Tax=Clostridium TaxID=1485 RepID=UPI0009BCE9B0|nr:dTDP-4-dehydrorhamnose reductase [Clostridium sp. CT7]